MIINSQLIKKYQKLKEALIRMRSAVIAFSGGLDSSTLVAVAGSVLGNNAVAVTARSPSYPAAELKEAKIFTRQIGIKHLILRTKEFGGDNFLKNAPDRCFWCKHELFSRIEAVREKFGYAKILDGANYDDRLDSRPGELAKKDFAVASPLRECKFTKSDIRILARYLRLPVWDKPAQACLASRVPFGERITVERLKRIEAAENILREFFGKNIFFRSRDHGNLARIEMPNEKWTKLKKSGIKDIIARLKKLGYKYITFDLEGYIPAGKR